ncbi:hypothetical protein [Leuconostoc gasicomitatum]|uniref:hypothetical protein n=1 Tax=Leuconostoc gasicomitatum TaxID=115778 RepID=UPI001CC73CDD|nr:hypothetical protein [Leuconostoc gasicomitatum]
MKNNKKWYKLPQLWILVVFIILIGGLIISSNIDIHNNKSSDSETKKSKSNDSSSEVDSSSSDKESIDSSSSESASSSSAAAKESSEDASSEAAEKDPNSYKTDITYEQIARTPDSYEDKKIQFTGKVLQTMENDDDSVQIRLAVDGNYDNILLVNIDKSLLNNSRILEDDLITVSGISKGTVSYKSTSGSKITVPSMDSKVINDQGKANDDYGY